MGIFYRFCEMLNAFAWGYRWNFWFNPNMQKTALWLTLAPPSPVNDRMMWTTFWQYFASLLRCEESSAATILSDVKHSISSLNSGNVLPIIVCWFYLILFEIWDIYCRKINADHSVVTKELIYKHSLWNKIVLHVCRSTLQNARLYSSDTSIIFFYVIF